LTGRIAKLCPLLVFRYVTCRMRPVAHVYFCVTRWVVLMSGSGIKSAARAVPDKAAIISTPINAYCLMLIESLVFG